MFVPDKRSHRGAHPEDQELFGPAAMCVLRKAAADYRWLINRGYAQAASLKLVGDRYRLARRQRVAIQRSLCSDDVCKRRLERKVSVDQLVGKTLLVDGFNVITTVEAALGGGVLLLGRDGALRDMASVHGTYRKVAETRPALMLIGEFLGNFGVANCRWLLDKPVSNSGRLRALINQLASEKTWDWTVDLVQNPDVQLSRSDLIAATADSAIMDRCKCWCPISRHVVDGGVPDAWLVDLTGNHAAGR